MARRRRRRFRRRHVQIAAVVLAIAAVVLGLVLFATQLDDSSPSAPPVAGGGGPGSGGGSTGNVLPTGPPTSKLGKNFRGLPGHKIVLTVTSSGSILRLGYLVPSADSDQVGDLHDVNGGFTKSFVARGPEGPYSAIFIQTNTAGTPVHCSVTVDGVQKNSQTITGAKKQGLCYG
jgi:hypothetical protein